MMKQSEAVFNGYTAGINSGLAHGSKELSAFVANEVFHGITAGDITYGKDRSNEKEVKNYASSVTSNYFKKDARISGAKYVPATKRGPIVKDEQLIALNVNLKSLRAHNADMGLISRVETAIEARKSEIAATKSATKVQSLEDTLASLESLGLA